jgi:hypothetical protein
MSDVLALKQKKRLDALHTEFVLLKVGSEEYYQCLERIRLEERKGLFSKKIETSKFELGGNEKCPLCDYSVLEKKVR